MNKDEISLLKHIIKKGNDSCFPKGIHQDICNSKQCPVWDMCKTACSDRPARTEEAQRLLNLHTSIIATEGEY